MSLSSKQPSGGFEESNSIRFTPQQSETFARINNRLQVHDYLPRTSHDGIARASKCEWSSHVAVSLTPEETGALAWILIDTIMKSRFGLATELYDTWRHHTLTGSTIPSPLDNAIAAFVEPVFGLPNAKKSQDQILGHLGEWLWYLLTKDNSAVRVQLEPKGGVTDSGGDGFSIYETGTGELRFRLWESKKNTSSGSLSTTLNNAYHQLADSGQRYVAMIVTTFAQDSYDTSEDVMTLVSQLPVAWAQGEEIIGAGVTLTTDQSLPATPFQKMANKLPMLDKPGQLRGLATSISCYVEIATLVTRYAWTAL